MQLSAAPSWHCRAQRVLVSSRRPHCSPRAGAMHSDCAAGHSQVWTASWRVCRQKSPRLAQRAKRNTTPKRKQPPPRNNAHWPKRKSPGLPAQARLQRRVAGTVTFSAVGASARRPNYPCSRQFCAAGEVAFTPRLPAGAANSSIGIEPGIRHVQANHDPADDNQDNRNQGQLNPAEAGRAFENRSPVDLVTQPSP